MEKKKNDTKMGKSNNEADLNPVRNNTGNHFFVFPEA